MATHIVAPSGQTPETAPVDGVTKRNYLLPSRAPRYGNCQPELLDTLIGSVYWAGVAFADGDGEEDEHTVQDSTGRTVTVSASVLCAHPAFERMTKDGQERLTDCREDVSHG